MQCISRAKLTQVNADRLYGTWAPREPAYPSVPSALLPKTLKHKTKEQRRVQDYKNPRDEALAKRKIYHCENRNRPGSSGLSQSNAPACSKSKEPGHSQVPKLSRGYHWDTKQRLARRPQKATKAPKAAKAAERGGRVSAKPLPGHLERGREGLVLSGRCLNYSPPRCTHPCV